MTKLDQNALDAAKCELNAIEGTTASKPAIAALVQKAITAYLDERRKRGAASALHDSCCASLDTLAKDELGHWPLCNCEVPATITAAIEEEREACARWCDDAHEQAKFTAAIHSSPAMVKRWKQAADDFATAATAIRARSNPAQEEEKG